jgi:hypothetical protein
VQARAGPSRSINYYGGCSGNFCIYYQYNVNWGLNGGQFGWNYYVPNLGQWQFQNCSQGGSSCPGLGLYVRNKGASMGTISCKGETVWYSTNYLGVFDWVDSYSWGNFESNLYKNEASANQGNRC